MNRMRITHNIEYIQPDAKDNYNCSSGLIISSSPTIFIDTNVSPASQRTFLCAEKPDIAIVSHYHSDHSAWLKSAQELCGSRVFVPEGEEKCLMDLDAYLDQCAGMSGEEIRASWRTITRDIRGFRVIDEFDLHFHGKMFCSGNTIIECIRCPGHSPSHTCFYLPEEKVLYVGDMGIGHPGPFYGASDCDLKEFVSSVLRLRGIKAKLVLTSHGGPLRSDIDPAWTRCLKHFLAMERFVRTRLDQGKGKPDIVAALLRRTNGSRGGKTHTRLMEFWISTAFDLYHDVLVEGGLLKIFPELRKVDGASKA